MRENTKRLNRLVEDVLRVARREPPQGDEFDLGEFVTGWLEEFLHDRAVAPGVVQVEVGVGVATQRLAVVTPRDEDGVERGVFLDSNAVDEAVDRRQPLTPDGVEDCVDDLQACHPGGLVAVRR